MARGRRGSGFPRRGSPTDPSDGDGPGGTAAAMRCAPPNGPLSCAFPFIQCLAGDPREVPVSPMSPVRAAVDNDVEATQTDAARAAEERRLFLRLQRFGDRTARDQLVERFMPLAAQLARRYRNTSQSFEDLLQVANLGLVQAVDRFDADRGLRFSSFAVPTILGELRRLFRSPAWAPGRAERRAWSGSRALQENVAKVRATQPKLFARLGRAPTP